MDRLQLRKKSALTGFGNGFLIGGTGGALVGVIAGNSPDSFFGPGASAVLGGIIFGSLGGLMGASSKLGFEQFYQFNAKKTPWTSADYEALSAKIDGQLNRKKRHIVLLAGLGYSSEVIHLGARYYLDDFNDISITGIFILAATKGVGIDYRRSFGQAQLSDRGSWFWLAGFSYKKSETSNRFGDDSTYYISGSFGRNFYFTKNSGISIDIGYDYATKEVLFKDKLNSFLGPRFQFFF